MLKQKFPSYNGKVLKPTLISTAAPNSTTLPSQGAGRIDVGHAASGWVSLTKADGVDARIVPDPNAGVVDYLAMTAAAVEESYFSPGTWTGVAASTPPTTTTTCAATALTAGQVSQHRCHHPVFSPNAPATDATRSVDLTVEQAYEIL